MPIKRLTYFFLTFFSEQTVEKSGKKIDILIFTSDFPFTFDKQLALPRTVRNTDIIKDEDGNFESLSVKITEKKRYNLRDWFIGIGINGKESWNGMHSPETDKETGIDLIYKNESISVFDAGFDPDGRGYVAILKESSRLGILDDVEIIIKSAKIKTPWIYYGNIPQRQAISEKQFNRNPSGMGGIPEFLVPSQAMGYEYYVDFDQKTNESEYFLPFPSFVGLTVNQNSSSLSDNYFMGDILNGDGRLAVRSNVSFKIFSISQNQNLGGTEIPSFRIINTGAFRTINYREMKYERNTYKPNKIIKNTRFYLAFQDNKKFNNIYLNISEILEAILYAHIDFNSCYFSIFTYGNGASKICEKNIYNKINLYNSIKNISQSKNESSDESCLSSLNIFIEKEVKKDAFKDNLLKRVKNTKYVRIVFGDMRFDDSQKQIKKRSIEFKDPENNKISISLISSGAHILMEQNENKKTGYEVFGSKISYIFGFKSSSFYGFQFLESLAFGSEILLKENDLYKEYDYFVYPIIKEQCENAIHPIENADWEDLDNDGLKTYVDRIISLYNNFNPSIDVGEETFFGSIGSEMNFWRKICPIGKLYSFYGEIISFIPGNQNGYLILVKIMAKLSNEEGNKFQYDFIDPGIYNNNIYVYYENGAKSNIANMKIDRNIFNIRGRLFYPKYWKQGNGIQIANGINLKNYEELSAWYRILPSTAKFLLEKNIFNDDPIIIVRTNIIEQKNQDGYSEQGSISNIFSNKANNLSFYKISQYGEKVQDQIIIEKNEESLIFQPQKFGSKLEIFRSISDQNKINFHTIEFEIDLKSSESVYYNFLYEIYWKSCLASEEHSLRRFWSAIVTKRNIKSASGFDDSAKITISLNDKFILPTSLSKKSINENVGKIFNVIFPYNTANKQNNEKEIYPFTWSKEEYKVQISLNNKIIPFVLDEEQNTDQNTINPFIGEIYLKNSISEKDSLYVIFSNITGEQGIQKTGSVIGIKLIKTPNEYDKQKTPIIKNIKINENTDETSIERVDCNYYNSGGFSVNRDHFIAPAFGYVTLSGRNWELSIDDRNSTSDGFGNVRITGSLVSPIWFFDAFEEKDYSKKLLEASTNKELAVIDRVYSNMVDCYAQPFVEILSVGFVPPPPIIMPRVSSIFDSVMRKFSIFYNVNNNIEIKSSYIRFEGRDTIDSLFFKNKSQKRTIGVYAGEERKEFLSKYSRFSIKSSKDPDSVLIGLEIIGGITGESIETQKAGVFELYARHGSSNIYIPFGYTNFEEDRLGLLCNAYNDGNKKSGFIQLPLTTNISSLWLKEYGSSEFYGYLDKVFGVFTKKYVEGRSPTIYEPPFGSYLMLFSKREKNTDLITGLISTEQGNRWSAPFSKTGKENDYEPIAILTGYVNPLFIQNEKSKMANIFLFNNENQSIVLFSIPFIAFQKLSIGVDKDKKKYSSEVNVLGKEGFSEVIKSLDSISWKKVFSEGRELYPIIFSATHNYSAVMDSSGGIYLASVSTSSKLRMLYSPSSSVGEFSPNYWFNFGIDILHRNGHLSKNIVAGDIYCIALSKSDYAQSIEIFIITKNYELILFRLPSFFINLSSKLKDQKEEKAKELSKKLQDNVNNIVPILVVGKNSQTSNDLYADGAIREDFLNQLPTIQWTPWNIIYVIYYKDDKVKGIKSTTGCYNWQNALEI